MNCTPRKLFGALLFSSLIGSYPTAQAAILHLPGATVDFYINNPEELDLVGGLPSVAGDTLKFSFHDFEVTDNDGATPDFKHITLLIDVIAKNPQNSLTNPTLYEQGDYLVLDTANSPFTLAAVFGQLIGDNLLGVQLETDNFAFQQDNTNITFPYPEWSIIESLEDVAGWGTSAVRLTFQNNVFASAIGNDDFAFIEKKFASISITAVPVPAAVWLLGSAVVPLLLMPRRRKA